MVQLRKLWAGRVEWLSLFHMLWGFVVTTLFSGFAGAVVYGLEKITYENFSNLSVVFLIPILYVAIYYGTVLAIYSSIFSCFIFDYFFIPPVFGLTQGIDSIIKFVVFLIAAVITSLLAGKVRSHALTIKEKEQKISLLYELGEALACVSNMGEAVHIAEEFIAQSLHVDIKILLPVSGIEALINSNTHLIQEENDKRALYYAFEKGIKTGRFMSLFDTIQATYIPLKTGNTLWGVMRLCNADKKTLKGYIDSVATQVAVGMERVRLYETKEKVLIEKEREVLRSALLSSLSHDLKTPLAAIMGAASMLKLPNIQLSAEQYHTLTSTIEDEAARLNRFIVNLLEITKLESGSILPNCEPVNLDDVIDSTLKRLRTRLEHHHVMLELADNLPLVSLDASLIQHVFINLLDNAVKYSEPGSTIILRGYMGRGSMVIEVEDEGPGVPADDLQKVFDKFYRVYRKDTQVAGTGLGLAICQSIVNVHEGKIFLRNGSKGKGLAACIIFPPHRLSMQLLGECA